jgi:hypothetical protein
MANPTTNFGWQMPTATDLVTDLPADFEVFGQAVDTALVDLKGGATGQVLAKASATDMDFSWVDTDDTNAIQNAIVDAKGDLISATANDTPARLAVGANGETLVADSSATTGLRYQGNFAAGKNKIINGDFRINQRGFTSVTTTTGPGSAYGVDRFDNFNLGGTGSVTNSVEAFTPGAAPVAGYEAVQFLRIATSGQTDVGTLSRLEQRIEDVRTFAGETVTISFYAKANSGTPNVQVNVTQNFGSGGSAAVTTAATKQAITTSWARYSFTISVPSLSGKTIGTGNIFLGVRINVSAGSNFNSSTDTLGIQSNTFDIWGVQAETGSVATAFQTATGTIQGELAACQRYYYRSFPAVNSKTFGNGFCNSTTTVRGIINFPVTMRTSPTALEQSGTAADYAVFTSGNTTTACSSVPLIVSAIQDCGAVEFTVASGLTAGTGAFLRTGASTGAAAYLGWSAEL